MIAPASATAHEYGLPGTLSDAGAGGHLGQSVSMSADGTIAVIGEPNADGGAGAALVYANADGVWSFVQRLQPTGEVGLGHFGAAVSVDPLGHALVVGAPDDNGTGAAYVFAPSHGVWAQQPGQLVPHGFPPAGARIGASVAIANDGLIALVGAPGWNSGEGEAFTFYYGDDPWAPRTTDWYFHQRMWRPGEGPGAGAHFGTSVALSSNGGSAVVGAPDADPAGKVFLYGHSYTDENWLAPGSITAPSPASGFGTSVVMSAASDELIIGAPLALGGAGAVYQYMSNGSLEQRLDDPSPSAGGHFGMSIAVAYASELLVGAPGDNAGAGAAYAFDAAAGGTWAAPGAPLAPLSDPAAGDAYGTSVAVAADRTAALIGAPGASGGDGMTVHFSASPTAKPDPPGSVQAVAGIEQASVSWEAPTSDGGSPITTYTVTAAPDGKTCTVPVPALMCSVSGLVAGTQYTFTVTATNYVGTSDASMPSDSVAPLSQPSSGGGTTGGGTTGGGTTGGGTTGGGTVTAPGSGSTPGGSGAAGGSTNPVSPAADRVSPTRPSGPLMITRRTRTTIALAWGPARDNTAVAGYRVFEYVAGRWKRVGTVSAGRRSFVRRGLRHRTRHRLAVRAYDGAGNLSLALIGPWATTR